MKKDKKSSDTDKQIELLQDILIVELAKVGVPQLEIRKIVGVDIYRVNRIVKSIKKYYEK